MSFDLGCNDDSHMYDSYEEQAARMSNSELVHQLEKQHKEKGKNTALIKVALARILNEFPIELKMTSNHNEDW